MPSQSLPSREPVGKGAGKHASFSLSREMGRGSPIRAKRHRENRNRQRRNRIAGKVAVMGGAAFSLRESLLFPVPRPPSRIRQCGKKIPNVSTLPAIVFSSAPGGTGAGALTDWRRHLQFRSQDVRTWEARGNGASPCRLCESVRATIEESGKGDRTPKNKSPVPFSGRGLFEGKR
jgi:hypothetical protein